MGILKKTGITLVIIILLLIVIFFAATGPVDKTPFYEAEYFKKSCTEIDCLKSKFTS